MSTIKGIVEHISEKSGGSGKRKWTMRSYCINNQWFGGFLDKDDMPPPVREGDEVEINFVENGQYNNWKSGADVQVVRAGETVPAPVDKNAPKGTTTDVAPISLKDVRSAYGGMAKVAAALLQIAYSKDLKGKQLDALFAAHSRLTEDLTLAGFNYNLKTEEDEDAETDDESDNLSD